MPKHDYYCESCTNLEADVVLPYNAPLICDVCESTMRITYELWTGDTIWLEDHGRSRNEKTDHNNFVKNWSANDDPLARIEITGGGTKDKGLVTFSADQQAAFRRRVLVDGDTPALRRDVLATRKENIRAARAERQKKIGPIEGKT